MTLENRDLYSSVLRQFDKSGHSVSREDRSPDSIRNFLFAMQCNGYAVSDDGERKFVSDAVNPFLSEFKGEKIAFSGPNSYSIFFSGRNVGWEKFYGAFDQEIVKDTIGKYREIDEDQAARIAFLFGGIVRFLAEKNKSSYAIERAVELAARMAKMADEKSADAVASASAMYVISCDAQREVARGFFGDVYHMIEAIEDDPIIPYSTRDLGISQVARLRSFSNRAIYKKEPDEFPDIEKELEVFGNFPTVGAEFHLPSNAPELYKNFWERVAILNMSQYQKGSYIQLSRNDRDVIEIRMNPSVFPVAVADWNYMRFLLPELNHAYFTVTVNRPDKNFNWDDADRPLLNRLRALGLLTYSGIFSSIPRQESSEEIDFGAVYLGQTVKMKAGDYTFDGLWAGGEGSHGQMGLYVGYGNTFPQHAYFLSMALKEPHILDEARNVLNNVRTLTHALQVSTSERSSMFHSVQRAIEQDERLGAIHEAGIQIANRLDP